MHVEDDMTIVDGLCNYRPQGHVSLVVGVEMITAAITHCRDRKISKLLVDVTELTGYPNPTLADRFWMVQDWAHAAQGELIVALVTLPAYIHPGKFGGKGQKIARCPKCRIAVWSHYAGAGDAVSFVRVGTLDDPDRLPPDVHIFTASKQPWVVLPAGVPAVAEYYKAAELWPKESLARREALLAAKKAREAGAAGS